MSTRYFLPDTTIYEQTPDGMMVIELDGGGVFHFNPEARAFLECFRAPVSLAQVVDAAGASDAESVHLRALVDELVAERILRAAGDGVPAGEPALPRMSYARPLLLRKERPVREGLSSLGCRFTGAQK